jgi:hypothetical protein
VVVRAVVGLPYRNAFEEKGLVEAEMGERYRRSAAIGSRLDPFLWVRGTQPPEPL